VRLAVVGSANLDLTVRVPRLPTPGETVVGGDLVRGLGGKGANQAVAAVGLGAAVTLVAAVGDDATGDEVRERLDAAGLDLTHVRRLDGVPSGVALIQVRGDGENTVTVSAGANARLVPTPEAARVVGAADAVLLQLEVPVGTALAAARAASGLVVLNAAPLPPPGSAAAGELGGLLAEVDVLVVNEGEAAGLLDAEEPPAGGTDVVDGERWAAVARRLRDLGPSTVVVTLGAHGAVAVDGAGAHRVGAFEVEAVDAVGAGDAFCAELAVSLAAGRDLGAAVRRACAAGALATTGEGAQGGSVGAAAVTALCASQPHDGWHDRHRDTRHEEHDHGTGAL
jgi:ribokinase